MGDNVSSYCQFNIISLLVLKCGDVETNSGPGTHCSSCGRYKKETHISFLSSPYHSDVDRYALHYINIKLLEFLLNCFNHVARDI